MTMSAVDSNTLPLLSRHWSAKMKSAAEDDWKIEFMTIAEDGVDCETARKWREYVTFCFLARTTHSLFLCDNRVAAANWNSASCALFMRNYCQPSDGGRQRRKLE